VALRAGEAEGDDVCACTGENNATNPTRKKARIITRFRYSAPIHRGKKNAIVRTARIEKLVDRSALPYQFSAGGSASPKTMARQSPKAQDNCL
jgi:hypothetical protein